ncbi:MAG: tyrosine protein phosphatase [wastewater metagenome]|nr:tyrosine protein phosphatase [Candidatus Loosdrechtia aerotolerans]
MIDIHTHILPMVDDGPATVEDAIEMCKIAVNDGIKKMIATPHVGNGLYTIDASVIQEKVRMMNRLLSQEGLDLVIFPGAEVHMNDQLLNTEILKTSDFLTLNGNKKYVLLEFSFHLIPPETERIIFLLKSRGFIPVLPHIERNSRVQKNPTIVERFVELGAIIQVTAQSITGDFGRAPKKCAHWMLYNNLVQVIASDAHSPAGRPPILSRAVKIAIDMIGEESAMKTVWDYPKMILEGMPLEQCKKFWKKKEVI